MSLIKMHSPWQNYLRNCFVLLLQLIIQRKQLIGSGVLNAIRFYVENAFGYQPSALSVPFDPQNKLYLQVTCKTHHWLVVCEAKTTLLQRNTGSCALEDNNKGPALITIHAWAPCWWERSYSLTMPFHIKLFHNIFSGENSLFQVRF